LVGSASQQPLHGVPLVDESVQYVIFFFQPGKHADATGAVEHGVLAVQQSMFEVVKTTPAFDASQK